MHSLADKLAVPKGKAKPKAAKDPFLAAVKALRADDSSDEAAAEALYDAIHECMAEDADEDEDD